MKTLHLRKSIGWSPLRLDLPRVQPTWIIRGFLLIPLLVGCFALLPRARAVVPAPDGGYAGNNTAEGTSALFSLTSGIDNSALGFQALYRNTTGNYNTADGFRALFSNITGAQNTANGVNALVSNTTGNFNTANGVNTLYRNTIGAWNTASGVQALFSNTVGILNTATGYRALMSNTRGSQNTAIGSDALLSNTTGNSNTAIGLQALVENTIGTWNTAIGSDALFANTTGGQNTANGLGALTNNTTGGNNTASGVQALFNNFAGSNNTANGYNAGHDITGSGNVCIGESVFGVAGVNNTTWIRNVYTTVQPVVGINPDYVTVNGQGRLGRANISSRRYKHDIKLMDKASEALFKLKPVSFRYNKEYDATQTIGFGLIAEEVAEVYPDLVGRNSEGQPESVRYEQINAMLLNEFLKEHHQMQDLKAIVAEQQKQIEALTAGLHQVNAQLEASKSAPQLVNNP